jgi:hypothetical protein
MTSLHCRLQNAFDDDTFENLDFEDHQDERDALLTLLDIYSLWLAPIDSLDGRERLQNHPSVAALKWRLEQWLIDCLDARLAAQHDTPVGDVADALRRIARRSHDAIYDWIATTADWDQLLTFLAIEGGPDGGFDDLVAIAQVGLSGQPKVVLGANYWDEMGRGTPEEVHTTLHDRLVQSIERSEFATVLDVLVNGDDGEVNEVRALQLLADHGGGTVTSRPLAQLYGFSSHSRVRPALERLRGRGLGDQRDDGGYLVDPLFNVWVRRASPVADRPLLQPSEDDPN